MRLKRDTAGTKRVAVRRATAGRAACRWGVSAIAAATLGVLPSPASADVLSQVPGDALAVVKVNGLREVSEKYDAYARQLGFEPNDQNRINPLASMRQELGIQQGLNEQGEMAFALFADPEADAEDQDDAPALVTFLPVSDYRAFLGNFPDAQTNGDVSQVELGESGETSYVVRRGEYAAVSTSRELVTRQPAQGVRAEGQPAGELDAKDVVLYANLPQLRNALLPKLNENRAEIVADITENIDDIGEENPRVAALKPVAEAAAHQMLNVAEAFLRDARGATAGFEFDGERGIRTTVLAEFSPDSYLGGLVSGLRGTSESLVRGLPSGNYLVFGGSAIPPQALTRLFDDVAGPVVRAAEGEQLAPVRQIAASLREYFGATRGSTFGVIAPEQMLGQGALLQTVQIERGDATTIRRTQRDLLRVQPQLSAMVSGEAGPEVQVQENARQVAGVSFDRVTVPMDAMGDDPQAAQFMAMLYGPEGQQSLTGEVAGRVLTVSGLNEQQITRVVEAVRADADAFGDAEGMAVVNENLPEEKLAVLYLPLGNLVRSGVTVAGPFLPIQIRVPESLPPVGLALTRRDSAVRVEGYVPTELIQALVTTGMDAQRQLMGGAQQGGPGGGL